ncbi:hypothetical protein QOV31_003894 [Agrobacterium fabrum]|uniref:Uncharacterized protein n=1 Tax=Agrobacterium fabrum TaxID=1176649 RepID=A0A7Z7BR57_9HYPH|nr:hypothetical protein [Agrobacterium fabrum]QQN08262.1 hypothetical protein EML4058_19605 [Agrobacterium fabrum]WJK77010.1 hypothetical protein QOV31_003894 [Agrobacterium fabrum]CAD0213550.1 hypothetical protein AGTUEHA105_LOCUS3956 [Agrobacterium tumefaciens]SDK21572.1 hypothetical protein SAMN05428983_4274 [Agrobacterium fabrum]
MSLLQICQGFVAKRRTKQNDGVDLTLVRVEKGVHMVKVTVDIDQHHHQACGLELLGKSLKKREFLRVGKVIHEDGDAIAIDISYVGLCVSVSCR